MIIPIMSPPFRRNWKGGRIVTTQGYIAIWLPAYPTSNKRYVLEHRYLMEQRLKRSLNRNEHVHHINGNKQDNRIENLIVLTSSAHQHRHHPKIHKPRYCVTCNRIIRHPRRDTKCCSKNCRNKLLKKFIKLVCPKCKRWFKIVPWKAKRHKRIFCSLAC